MTSVLSPPVAVVLPQNEAYVRTLNIPLIITRRSA